MAQEAVHHDGPQRRESDRPLRPAGRPHRDDGLAGHLLSSGGAIELPEWAPGTVVALATGGAEPHVIPVSAAVRAGPALVLIALAAGRGSLSRIRAEPRVAVMVLCEGDLAFTAYGSARVVDEALIDGVAGVAIDVGRVVDHVRPSFTVESGVGWRWTDGEAEARDREVRLALTRLAGFDIS